MKTKRQFRQGDVLISAVDEIPAGGKLVELDNGRIVLAYGEVTGHAHAIVDVEHVAMVEVDGAIRYLDVQMEAFLRHEEHSEVRIPAGLYRVTRQREYFPEGIQNVAD